MCTFHKKIIDILRKNLIIIITYFFLFQFNHPLYSQPDPTAVERYGLLRVEGNQVVDKNGDPVSLRGMSLFWSQWEGARFYNNSCVEWLRDDWECTVVRASMGIEGGGYLQNPQTEKNKVINVIEACIDLGIYVIVDWHDHNAQNHTQQAINFFAEIAQQYGDYPNLIYEIFNEPLQVSWTNVVKPYADAVVDTIRKIDPDNIITVGSPTWSQDVDIASQNPVKYNNIAYSLHFYAATHKQSLRNKAITALNNGIALWVTEFGTCESNGSGVLDSIETETWMNFMETRKISWCNWSVVDKDETSAALKSGASSNGGWPLSALSRSGQFVREKIISLTPPLPVELTSFTVKAVNDYVLLKWTTASEINNRGFEIFRKIIEDNSEESEWILIGFVEGNGTVTDIQNYSFIDENLSDGKYLYRLKQIDFNGSFKFSDEVLINFNVSGFYLNQNYPNPFNPVTTIEYELEKNGHVNLEIFDIEGSRVRTLIDDFKSKGKHKINWDGMSDKRIRVSSGVYYYQLRFENKNINKKAVFLN